jgi:hypothetical protein
MGTPYNLFDSELNLKPLTYIIYPYLLKTKAISFC